MDLKEYLLDSLRTVFKEQMPGILNSAFNEYFGSHQLKSGNSPQNDNIKIDRVREITGYATPTIYSKVHRNEIPVLSKGRPLLFSELHIKFWILAGRPKTSNIEEIKKMVVKNGYNGIAK